MTNVLSINVNGFECNTYHSNAFASLCGIIIFEIVQSVLCLRVQTWSCESAMPPQRTQSDLGNGKLKQTFDPKTNFDLSQERRRVGRRDVERFWFCRTIQRFEPLRRRYRQVDSSPRSVKWVWAFWINGQVSQVSRRRRNRLILFWPSTQEILLHVQPGDGKPFEAPSPVRCRKLEPSLQDWDSVEYAEMRFDFTAKKTNLKIR